MPPRCWGLVGGCVAARPRPGPRARPRRAAGAGGAGPNIAQADKWDEDKIPEHIDRLLTLTAALPEGEADRPALILWPETAVPYLLEWADPLLDAAAAAAQGGVLVAGIQRREGGKSLLQRADRAAK